MNDAILIKLIDQLPAIVTALGIIITAYFSYRSNQQAKVNTAKIAEVHDSVNGKMEQLLSVTGKSEHAKGKLEGEALPQKISIAEGEAVKVEIVEPEEKV